MLNQLLIRLLAWIQREEGQDLVEYALVTVVISVAIATAIAVSPLGDAFDTWTSNIADAING